MKSYVTFEQAVCPACGASFDTGALLLDRLLRPRFDHYTPTHFQLCPDDQQKVDEGYTILVAIDHARSGNLTPAEVYRTGEMAYVRKHVVDTLFNHEGIDEQDLVWVEPEVIERLSQFGESPK